jgi:predicted dehydrogenase
MASTSRHGDGHDRIRYAVVGLGHIAQVAVLPAFANADNAELVALVSGDPVKRRELGARHGIERLVDYGGYDDLLQSGEVDAVYVAVPNHLHADYTVRAARAGVHVLCEKPMAVTERECEQMIHACADHGVKLMIAYRLHFEPANLEAIELTRAGALGELRFFESSFSQDVVEGDIRLAPLERGGGTVYDMGVYCINAARYLFRDEPVEVVAMSAHRPGDRRFTDCDEMTSAVLRFPGGRLASFNSSFGAAGVSSYRLVGDRGSLHMDPAYGYAVELGYELTVDGESRGRKDFDKHDQFAPELVYFANCIQRDEEPEPDGAEGLADVRIIRAIYHAASSGNALSLTPVPRRRRPDRSLQIVRPGFEKPEEIHASGPTTP